jgi:SAM-dependent methyltransferase
MKNKTPIEPVTFVNEKEWDLSYKNKWVGGQFVVSNLSGGYHGILKQWWEFYGEHTSQWLLISENTNVKQEFKNAYPLKEFKTLEFYEEMNSNADLQFNLCEEIPNDRIEQFDMIVCQATFEHLYNPVTALKNLANLLSLGGIVVIHTHVPGFQYHQYPRDYFRFFPDWFIDAEKFVGDIILKELCVVGPHIFSAYQKIEPQLNKQGS